MGFLFTLVPVSILFVVVVADTHDQLKLSEYLWQQTTKERQSALNSTVIQGMVSGTLNPSSFGAYMVQDVVYLYNSQRLIDIAASRMKDQMYRELLKDMSETYKELYEYLLDKWQIKYPSGVRLGRASSKYLHHLYDMAANFDTGYFITAMIPCYKLWPWLGNQIGATQNSFGVYTEWVNVNLDPTSDSYLELEDLINKAEEAGKIDRQMALTFFRRSMQSEVEFFSLM